MLVFNKSLLNILTVKCLLSVHRKRKEMEFRNDEGPLMLIVGDSDSYGVEIVDIGVFQFNRE